ncbi:hypothetical protein BVX98_01150 [bacterium F11]|nr:hypothetical protein BVX98_01150 [bacterium F11]
MAQVEVEINGKKEQGFEIPLPTAPLVGVYSSNGFVMCGYLNLSAAEKLGVSAAMVKGVKTVDDLLKASIQGMTKKAEEKGVKIGMTGKEALSLLS